MVDAISGNMQEPPKRITKKFDENGRIVQQSIFSDVNGDRELNLHQITNFTYNQNGRTETTYIDNDGDGYYDEMINRTYNADGKLVKEEQEYQNSKQLDPLRKFGRKMGFLSHNGENVSAEQFNVTKYEIN